MSEWVRSFCVLAAFCGAALRLAPEGGVRRILSVLISAVLLTHAFQATLPADTQALEQGIGLLREREQRLLSESSDYVRRLDRLVIEEELRSYIQNKAGQKGLHVREIALELRWQTEGFWLPVALTLYGSGEREAAAELRRELEAELGIPGERQRWISDEGLEG